MGHGGIIFGVRVQVLTSQTVPESDGYSVAEVCIRQQDRKHTSFDPSTLSSRSNGAPGYSFLSGKSWGADTRNSTMLIAQGISTIHEGSDTPWGFYVRLIGSIGVYISSCH